MSYQEFFVLTVCVQVMIVMEEEREGVLQFVTSLCAIIGGVITVMR